MMNYIVFKNTQKQKNKRNEYGSFYTHVAHSSGSDTKNIFIQRVRKGKLK